MRIVPAALVLIALAGSQDLLAQEMPSAGVKVQCPAGPAPCIPPLTSVRLTILEPLGSQQSASGQAFAIELAEPIVIDGQTVVAAGARGQGEVVHAKRNGGSGAAGELILAARYLEVGRRRLRLRSMNLALVGQDSIGKVNQLMFATAASAPALAVLGYFVKGKEIVIPAGQAAQAKTAEPFVLEPASPPATGNQP